MLQPVFLHREFADIVAAVSVRLLPQLQLVDPEITGVHYQYGHPLEIIKTLGGFDGGVTTPFKKYPLVAFFLDSTVKRGTEIGIYGSQKVNMAIIRMCKDPNQNAAQRDEFNFIPVLNPIYLELMQQISYRGDLLKVGEPEQIEHDVTNRYYWGRSGLWGNEKNIFNDWVDAIEINNMQLTINSNYCPKPAVII